METFDYGVLGTLTVLVLGMLSVLYDLKYGGGKMLGLANSTLEKIENSPMLDSAEWLAKEVIPLDVLNKFNDSLEKARQDTKEAYLELRSALDTTQVFADRVLGILEKVTDGKPNTPGEVTSPADLLSALQNEAKKHGFVVKEVPTTEEAGS